MRTWNDNSYSYDGLDRLVSENNGSRITTYSYDKIGNRTAGGGINYTYDTYKNRLLFAGNVSYAYDANHNRIEKREGSLRWQYEYDPENRLTRVIKNGQEIGKYYYNPAGLRVKKIEDGKTTVYVYHDSQSIYEETFNTTNQANLGVPAKKELHVYIKNLKVARYINGVIRYQLLDHLGSTRVEADAARKPVALVNYGAFGQAEGENEYETSRINGDFEAGTTAPAKWTRTDWSGDSTRSTGAHLSSGGVNNSKCVKLETLADSANALWWLSGGVPVAGDTKYEFTGYYKCLNTATTNARVSIRTLDADGNVLDYLHLNLPNATSWSPFSFKFKTHPDAVKIQLLVRLHGKAGQAVLYDSVRLKLDSTVEAESYSYTGKNKDKSTQLVYFAQRYYDPEVGRFITEDPARDGDNWFVYCRNNPLKYVDPTGMYYEATAMWGSTGWVLAGVDTFLPFGDIVYAVGVAGCAIYDTWVLIGDKIPGIIEGVKQTATDLKEYFSSRSPEGPDFNEGPNFKNFTKRNFRHNLKELTGKDPKDAQAHHIFPQKYAKIFRKAGIDNNDPRYGSWWKTTDHLKNAASYNQKWKDFLESGIKTKQEILEFGRQMAEQYGLEIHF